MKASLSKSLIILIIFLSVNSVCYSENFEHLLEGQKEFNEGNYMKAMKLWQQQADQGKAEAQVFVGLAYANGWGVKKDLEEASNWYLKAAENNSPSGQFLLGLLYVTSSKSDYDIKVGLKWLNRAAKNGDQSAVKFLNKAKRKNWFGINGKNNIDRNKLKNEGKLATDNFSASNFGPVISAPEL